MMDLPSPAFCDECGAALSLPATHCPVCQQDLQSVSPASIREQPGNNNGIELPVVTTVSSPPNSRLRERYVLLKEIGKGGFAVVYMALDRYQRNQLVAVKQINLRDLSARDMIEATDTYNREVSLLARLKHKHLPHLIDHFTDPEHWYIVMDFIHGETLEDYLKHVRGGRLSVEQVVEIGIVLCDVLQYLHSQRPPIVFRDVKPGNIMYTHRRELYLIDFGIARLFSSGKGHDTGALGSPGYAAPEQYGKARTTPQTDIYGLGATLQTLFTGLEPPELAASQEPHRYLRRIPIQLREMIQKMMAPNAQDRPALAAIQAQLEHFREYNLPGQKIKHLLAPINRRLHQRLFWEPLIATILACTLIGTPLLLPALLLVLSIVLGRSAMECYIEMAWSSTRLPWKSVMATFPDSFKQMLPLICLLLLYCFAAVESIETGWSSAYLFVLVIISGTCFGYLAYWLFKIGTVLLRIHNKQRQMRAHSLHTQEQYQR